MLGEPEKRKVGMASPAASDQRSGLKAMSRLVKRVPRVPPQPIQLLRLISPSSPESRLALRTRVPLEAMTTS